MKTRANAVGLPMSGRSMALTLTMSIIATGIVAVSGCGGPIDPTMPPVEDPPAGKQDVGSGPYTCKPAFEAEPMSQPEITISIADPPLIRLRDRADGTTRYYPAGVGVLKGGVSRTWEPVTFGGGTKFSVNPQAPEAGCRTREWVNPHDSSEHKPYYAGLPWMPFYGTLYAIHGPIDRYWEHDGGTLSPGYVSHGCVRMDSFDLRQLYAQIKHLTEVPVTLTKQGFGEEAAESAFGFWVMDPCTKDHQCRRIAEGYCRKPAPDSASGVCSARCKRYCPDRSGAPMTFCIADPRDESNGYCVNRATSTAECDAGLLFEQDVSRFNDADADPQDICRPDFD